MSNYKTYFAEAYRQMLLEKDFDISKEALDGIKDWQDADTEHNLGALEDVETLEIIDPNAFTEEEVDATDYIGKVILECVSCKHHISVDESEVYKDDELGTLCPDIECPVCGSNQGYTAFGKIEHYEPAEEEEEEEKLEFPVEDDEVEEEEEEEEVVEESLHDRIRRRGLKEAAKKVCPKCGKDPCVCESCSKEEELDEGKDCADCEEPLEECGDKKLTEAVNNLSLDTDDTHLEMTADENGRISVVSEPTTPLDNEVPDTMVPGEDSVVPLDMGDEEEIEANISPEDQEEIMNNEEEPLEEPADEKAPEEEFGEEEFEVEEESFNYLGNTFAKKLYENVSDFKVTGTSDKDGKLVIEGMLTFNSGKQKPTQFIFEDAQETQTGRIIFEGLNKTFFPTKAFKLRGKLVEGKLVCESLRYNYSINRLNESTGAEEPVSVRGIIRGK